MSALYAQAIQSGIQAIHVGTGGDNAGTIAAYNSAYGASMQKYAYLNAKTTAESNIGAINQDEITANAQIKMSQQQAEAAAQVSAAVAGVSGSSVDSVIYETEKNASFASANVSAQADQATEQQLAAVNAASIGSSSIPKIESSNALMSGVNAGLGALSLASDDEMSAMGDEASSAFDGLSSLWSA